MNGVIHLHSKDEWGLVNTLPSLLFILPPSKPRDPTLCHFDGHCNYHWVAWWCNGWGIVSRGCVFNSQLECNGSITKRSQLLTPSCRAILPCHQWTQMLYGWEDNCFCDKLQTISSHLRSAGV